MQDQIVLLESKKEVTTFLLDDGDITSKEVTTKTGTDIGYEYTEKLYPEDTVTISEKSEIGKERVKKYTGGNDEIPIGIIVNDPIVMDNGQRKASVLVLGQLYRLKLASGVSDIVPADNIKLSDNGAIKDSSGEFLALHPVVDSDEYNYVNCFKLASGGAGQPGAKGDTGDTGPAGPKGDTGAKGDTGDTGPKGDTGDDGTDGSGVEVYKDTAHREIMFEGASTSTSISFSEITGPKGDTGDTGPVNLAGSLDTTDNTNAIKNAPVATAIQNLQTNIDTITAAQQSNLDLLGS